MLHFHVVIQSFRHKGLRELFCTGLSRRVSPNQRARILRLLDVLESATAPEDMNLPGCFLYRLHGRAERYSLRVTGNWRLTLGWDEAGATDVDLEDYHR